jgi:hypothetical protein
VRHTCQFAASGCGRRVRRRVTGQHRCVRRNIRCKGASVPFSLANVSTQGCFILVRSHGCFISAKRGRPRAGQARSSAFGWNRSAFP